MCLHKQLILMTPKSPPLLKLRITNERAGGCVSNSVQARIFSVCVCVCVLAQRSVEERKARSGVLLMLLTAFGVFVALCEAGSTSWGSPLGPRQSQLRIIHPRTKCVITMRKPGSSSPAAEDCQACWRGGLLLISCGEALNAGAHSPPYTHIQGDTMARTHAAARMLIRTSAHRRTRHVAHA